jgi:hypothetical protein
LEPQRQMVESEEVSADGLVWTFRLRPGPKFHDGEKVLARDAVASINRWAVREPMGGMVKAIENELAAVDDRTFRWSLKRPYPKMVLALGKIGTPCCVIMPARIAETDPFRLIGEYVGSGPLRFVRNEWVPGARAVFEKFSDYVSRPEPASWLAGGKRIRGRSAAERRGGLVGATASRPGAGVAGKPQSQSRHFRPARLGRHAVHEPSIPTVQRRAGAPRDPGGDEPGRLHACLCGR